MQRRDFLKLAMAAPLVAAPKLTWAAGKKNKVLFLGGRGYFGPVSVQALIDAGHDVTITNRGITNPHLFPELRWIYCDREIQDGSGLKELLEVVNNEKFDWVVDTWQKHPAAVLETARLFRDRIPHYQYVSTVSSYDDWNLVDTDETFALNPLKGATYDWAEEHRYGLRKTMGELAVMENYAGAFSIVRSHGMRGFPESKDDVPYWPVKIRRGGDILVPGDGSHTVQFTDMKSLAEFMVLCGVENITGDYTVAYPPTPFLDYIAAIMKVTGTRPNFHWVPEQALEEYGIRPYRELSYWRPNRPGAYAFKVDKALNAGLRNRPLTSLVSDQFGYYDKNYPNDEFQFGIGENHNLSAEREAEILSNWLAKQKKTS